jgi:hypothetical protein
MFKVEELIGTKIYDEFIEVSRRYNGVECIAMYLHCKISITFLNLKLEILAA